MSHFQQKFRRRSIRKTNNSVLWAWARTGRCPKMSHFQQKFRRRSIRKGDSKGPGCNTVIPAQSLSAARESSSTVTEKHGDSQSGPRQPSPIIADGFDGAFLERG